MIPVIVRFIWPSVFRGEDVQKSTNKKQELSMPPRLFTDRDEMSNLHRVPSIDASYHVKRYIWDLCRSGVIWYLKCSSQIWRH
jgi:hypothetical protein